jgi:hypothetical protein
VTTIASDGKTVAADSLRVGGGEIIDATTPKLVIYQKMLFGFTGTMALFRPAVRWYELGAKPGEQPNVGDDKAHWSLYRFLPEGADRYCHDLPYPEMMPYPFSAGSGCDYAMGALHAGATPARAVEIAAKLDPNTGGKILEYPVQEFYAMVERHGDRFRIA